MYITAVQWVTCACAIVLILQWLSRDGITVESLTSKPSPDLNARATRNRMGLIWCTMTTPNREDTGCWSTIMVDPNVAGSPGRGMGTGTWLAEMKVLARVSTVQWGDWLSITGVALEDRSRWIVVDKWLSVTDMSRLHELRWLTNRHAAA